MAILLNLKEKGNAEKHREVEADMVKAGCRWKQQETPKTVSSGKESLMAYAVPRSEKA